MDLFKQFKKSTASQLSEINADNSDIVAIADGKLIDAHTVSDLVFSQEMMGKSSAFAFDTDKVVLCSPANGTLSVLFPTGHAFGITTNEGVELLIHCGVDTVNANGNGFRILSKKQGDTVKAGEAIIEVDLKRLRKSYDMSTMLIITNNNGKELNFIPPQNVIRGQKIIL